MIGIHVKDGWNGIQICKHTALKKLSTKNNIFIQKNDLIYQIAYQNRALEYVGQFPKF